MAFFNFSILICVLLLAVPSLCSSHHLDASSHHSLHRHKARHAHKIHGDARILVQRQESTPVVEKPALLANASRSDLEKARQVVKAAIQQAAQHNKARLDNPARNNYSLKPGTSTPLVRKDVNPSDNGTTVDQVAPLFNVTEEIASAAALLAEADAYEKVVSNATLTRRLLETRAKLPSKWWLGIMDHKSPTGGWPFGKNAGNFTVFRDVTDAKYGAKGDGITDDTEAIRKAVADGEMCGPACYSSTTKGAIIYFPPGTYLVSGTIETYFGTQFIGDAVERPTIKASGSFVGLGVISTDKYVGGYMPDGSDKQWFINTANFYRQIRNLNIDIQSTDPGAYVCAIHYQVGQATSLQYLTIVAKPGTTQQGIFAENGSGGYIGDIEFVGGNFGIYGGSQQFTAQRLTFNGCNTAVQIIWDWSWTWKTIKIKDATTGFRLLSENGQRNTGSILVVDSWFENVGTAILTFPAKALKGDGTTGLTLDNVKFTNTKQGVVDTDSFSYLSAGQDVDSWVLGRIYVNQQKQTAIHTPFKTPRDKAMTGPNDWGLPKAPFYEKSKPQYDTESASNIHHVQSSCAGDGKTIVTSCVQNFIDQHANNGIIYFDAGSYMLDNTIAIPPGVRIVGEVWSQLVAVGTAFQDEKSPKPLIKVGNKGSVGKVEMQDLIFTSKGPTAGVVFVEWNIRADEPGSAGMWDCHVRVGGAVGTDLTVNECPAGSVNDKCKAGAALMHMTPESSGYLENVWLWVADHDIDDPDLVSDENSMLQCSIFVARGFLIESKRPTWLYGTASEHAVFYQYEFYKAENVYAAMIQTESPYYQPTPNPPAPFQASVKAMPGDPAYNCGSGETCDSSWALRILESKDILIHGAGLYSWFDTYTQTCLQTISCQKSLIEFKNNGVGIRIHNLITIGAKNMIEADNGVVITAADNQAVDFHPRWSQISVFEPSQFINHCTGLPENTNPSNIPEGETLAVKTENEGLIAYFTIVNGCNQDFEFLSQHQHQMQGWDDQWVTIPAGESAQFDINFIQGIGIKDGDTAGEAYYRIKNTDKTFHVSTDYVEDLYPQLRARISYEGLPTEDTAEGTMLDLGFPTAYEGNTLQWVLTGSEEYGYWSSNKPPIAYMQSMLSVIGDRKLKYVTMIGSHDAGMSEIDGSTAFSNWQNTQTQWLDVYGQLVLGSRWFDIRPCLGNGGKHMTCHYTVTSGSAVGSNGLEVQEVIDQINKFMSDHPGELVIVDLNNESGFDTDHRTSASSYNRLSDAQWEPIWKNWRDGIKKPCTGHGDVDRLDDLTINDFIGDGKGCVLTIYRNIPGVMDEDKGFYPYGKLTRFNQYANTDSYQSMRGDQISKLQLNRKLGNETDPETNDEFFILSWTMTLGAGDALTPMSNRAAIAQSSLFWSAYHEFTPYSYPNVIYVDFVGQPFLLDQGKTQDEYLKQTAGHLIGLAMAVNLQIASRNCFVGGGSI